LVSLCSVLVSLVGCSKSSNIIYFHQSPSKVTWVGFLFCQNGRRAALSAKMAVIFLEIFCLTSR
jgi:hypothetical protein